MLKEAPLLSISGLILPYSIHSSILACLAWLITENMNALLWSAISLMTKTSQSPKQGIRNSLFLFNNIFACIRILNIACCAIFIQISGSCDDNTSPDLYGPIVMVPGASKVSCKVVWYYGNDKSALQSALDLLFVIACKSLILLDSFNSSHFVSAIFSPSMSQ